MDRCTRLVVVVQTRAASRGSPVDSVAVTRESTRVIVVVVIVVKGGVISEK